MKHKRGSIVEVLAKDEFCYHSWRCAQIVSGNGHSYTVSYDVYPGFTDKEDVERISVKFIRPCPPLLEISESWVPGDAVEVFYNLSWKMAIVLKPLGWHQFLIRLVGSFQEFEVTKSELRARQSFQNGEWIVIGKVPGDNKDPNHTKLSKNIQKYAKGDIYTKDLCFATQSNNNHLMESLIVSFKTLKRASPCCYSQANEGGPRKLRVSEKEGRHFQVPGASPEKV